MIYQWFMKRKKTSLKIKSLSLCRGDNNGHTEIDWVVVFAVCVCSSIYLGSCLCAFACGNTLGSSWNRWDFHPNRKWIIAISCSKTFSPWILFHLTQTRSHTQLLQPDNKCAFSMLIYNTQLLCLCMCKCSATFPISRNSDNRRWVHTGVCSSSLSGLFPLHPPLPFFCLSDLYSFLLDLEKILLLCCL